MMKEIELHPRVSELNPQTVGGALYAATYSRRAVYKTDHSATIHLYNWLSGFIDTGDYDHRNHECPAKAHVDKEGGECSICQVIDTYLNSFTLARWNNPLNHLETLMQTISNRASLVLRNAERYSDEARVAMVVYPYLSAAADQINLLVMEEELSKMENNGDITIHDYVTGEDDSINFEAEHEELQLIGELKTLPQILHDWKMDDLKKKEVVDYRTDEWENVTPVKQPRASEMTNMDTDSLLDLYNYYTQLNSFYQDGSFDRNLGLIKAVLSDRTKKVVKF
ncbi:hypothetical protein LD13_gp046 [Bacillus phage Bobb]|uniref:Uncharacterized protein n=1 Tax=Bacillus phage Bobb TaxID=1527469 RepID=A0A076G6P1_9CAUD|nr:hypothetical protein LD13_gp046 [Bacillus phage Bobb]AII27947.1 hypothetical protein [Bacillus phage Bobb]